MPVTETGRSGPNRHYVASHSHPNGWSVDFDGQTFNVSAPLTADVGDGYRVRYHGGNSLALGGSSGTFGVTSPPTTATTASTTGTSSTTSTTTGTTGGGAPTIQIIDIKETRAHVLTVDYQVNNGAPSSSQGSNTQNGIVYTTVTGTTYSICSDTALNDPMTTTASGAVSTSFSGQTDTMWPGTPKPTFNMAGFVINSNTFPFTITPPIRVV